VPENLHACQFRQTSDLHNSPHWTIHAAISTIAAISSLRSPPLGTSCIKQARPRSSRECSADRSGFARIDGRDVDAASDGAQLPRMPADKCWELRTGP
jgi:hypothetical protein